MRELKFRRWDTEYNRFFYIDFSYVKKVDFYDFFEYVDGPIEQYTGLKDKNGKEIYEGDIIIDEERYISTISWSDFKFMWVDSEFGSLEDVPDDIEVLGNVHENPELLSASQGVSK